MCLNMLQTDQVQVWPSRRVEPPGLRVLWTCQDWCLTDKQVNAFVEQVWSGESC